MSSEKPVVVNVYTAWADDFDCWLVFKDGLWYASGYDGQEIYDYLPEGIVMVLNIKHIGESYYATCIMEDYTGCEEDLLYELRVYGVDVDEID